MSYQAKLEVKRPEKFGGNKTYTSFEKLVEDFRNKKLHPMDFKNTMADKINEILGPARKHFSDSKTKKLKEEMDKILITR